MLVSFTLLYWKLFYVRLNTGKLFYVRLRTLKLRVYLSLINDWIGPNACDGLPCFNLRLKRYDV